MHNNPNKWNLWRHYWNWCCLVLHKMTFYLFIYFTVFFCVMCCTPIGKDRDQFDVGASFQHSKCPTQQHFATVLFLCLCVCGNFYWHMGKAWFQRSIILSSPWVVSQHPQQLGALKFNASFIYLIVSHAVPPLIKTMINPTWKSTFRTLKVSNQTTLY